MILRKVLFLVLSVLAAVFLFALLPSISYAGVAANAMCAPETGLCPWPKPCNPPAPKPIGVLGKFCKDTTSGLITKGECIKPLKCQAVSYEAGAGNEGGAADAGLSALKGLLDQVMKALGGGGGGGGGLPPLPPPPGGGEPPLAPNVLDQITPNTSEQLLDGIKDEGSSGILDSVFGIFGDDEEEDSSTEVKKTSTIGDVASSATGDSSGATSGSTGSGTGTGDAGNVIPGAEGDVQTISGEQGEVRASDNEATFEARVRDEEENTEAAGFYGFTALRVGQVGIVERLCTSRPWSNSFVSRIIPDTFFDGLCTKRGFQAGLDVAENASGLQLPANITEAEDRVKARIEERVRPNVGGGEPGILCDPEIARPGNDIKLSFSCGKADLTGTSGFTVAEASETNATVSAVATAQYGIACSNDKKYACVVQVFDPRVSIWADPVHVPLGSRTTIFWNAEDVDGCVVRGPSFLETGQFGGASTVPINRAATYTITCDTPDGEEIAEDITVDLSV